MVITVANAAQVLSVVVDIAMKIQQVLATKEPQSIAEELSRLDAARLRPSQEIIDEADKFA
jgi:hypothetical protein